MMCQALYQAAKAIEREKVKITVSDRKKLVRIKHVCYHIKLQFQTFHNSTLKWQTMAYHLAAYIRVDFKCG